MFRPVIVSLGFLTLAACASTSTLPTAELVPVKMVLSETRGQPYECLNYDAGTDSCEILSKNRVRGDTIKFETTAMFRGPQNETVQMRIIADFEIVGSLYCGDMADVEIEVKGDLSAGERSLLQELMLAEMIRTGEVCGAYFRESGQYLSVTTDGSGRIIPDSVDRVQFFKAPKRLRPL